MRGILIAVLVLSAGAFAAAEDDEWVRPYDPYLPGTEPLDGEGGKKVVAVRLLRRDEAAIVPVVGGRVSCWTEDLHGAELVGEAKTDGFGIANLTATRGGGEHWHFEGDGAAPGHEFTAFAYYDDTQVILRPGRDVPIEVLGPFGKPLAGATVEAYLGCPHSPAVRSVTTDDAGCAVLADMDGGRDFQLWILAPGVQPGPYDLGGLTVDTGGHFRVIAEPGVSMSGRVVDEEGKALSGVAVCEQEFGRGPRTVTDKRGRFILHGLSGAPIGFYRPGAGFDGRPSSVVTDYDPRTPLVIRLREDRPTVPAEGEPRHLLEVVVLREWPSDRGPVVLPDSGVPLRIVRTSDGFTLRGRSGKGQVAMGDANGLVRFSAPPGTYRVLAGGGWSHYEPVVSAEVHVPLLKAEPIRVTMSRVRVRVGVDPVGKGEPELAGFHAPGLRARGDYPGYVPRTGPVAAVYEEPVRRVLLAAPEKGGVRKITWSRPEPTRVRVRVGPGVRARMGMEGLRVALVHLLGTPEMTVPFKPVADGWLEAFTWAAGPAQIRVEPGDWKDPRAPVTLPFEAGQTVTAGELKLVPYGPREVRFTTADGKTPVCVELEEEPEVDLMWEAWWDAEDGVYDRRADTEGFIRLELDGRRVPVTLRVVRHEIETEGVFTTLPMVLTRDTPEVVKIPAGRITGTVRGYKGPMSVVAYLDHDEFRFEDGKIDIRGVADGPHTLIVGARGHRGEVRRIVLKDGETRDLEIRLPRRISTK